jgi:branched-chain amino acid transport system permease protein
MITLAFGQMAYFIENSPLSHYTGGENGIPGVPVPMLGFGEHAIRVGAGLPMYVLFAVIFFGGYVLARRIVRSPVGAILLAIKENTARVAMLGHNVPAYKLTAFVIAALYAGLAGGLLGSFQSYMPPDAFALETSGQLVVQTIVGGANTLIGPLVGAAVWLWLRDNLQLIPGLSTLWKLVLGIAFIVLVVALRRGICGEIIHWWTERRTLSARQAAEAVTETIEAGGGAMEASSRKQRDTTLPLPSPATADSDIALEACALARHYGGLKAVDGVSFKVRAGTIHAVIGPNGAGKSTLFKMLLDEVSPTSGHVLLFGSQVTGHGVSRTAQFGIAKSNQLNQLFPNLSVRKNLRIAALSRCRGPLRIDLLRTADSLVEVEAQIDAIMALLDLARRSDTPAHILAYGEKRRLEIGMALATSPKVLLLDEPLAGMSPSERAATCALIRDIAQTCTIVIVEHDLDAIFGLAERITVLYEGRLLADGTADEIRSNQQVQDAYLGGLHAHEPA